ncbi:MAG: hypothetical protein WD960_14255 [Gemmatimonadota bacterium]
MPKRSVSTVQLTVVLAIFFLLGSVMAHFIWHTMSGFLAGQPVEGGSYLLALAVTGLFFGLAWLLGLYIQSTLPTE